MIIDAMKGYILPDDNRKWVKHVSCEFCEKKTIMVEVMLACSRRSSLRGWTDKVW
mgnify:CR=1 FL=1